MAAQLLFYHSAVPVSSQRHLGLSVKVGADFGFARGVHAVPLTAVEIGRAAAEYPVVFTGEGENLMPVVVLGLEVGHNLFVRPDGTWDGSYIPAFVRRYPFVFSASEDGRSFTLCLDESFAGCNREGRGEALFDAEGERTSYLNGVLHFVREYQVQHDNTRVFCSHLQELGLLEPMQAQFRLPGGGERNLTGFMAVNRVRLKALPPERLADLAVSDELELIYLHLHSLINLERLLGRAGAPIAREPSSDQAPGAGPA